MAGNYFFEKIIAWQKSHAFALAVYTATKSFPDDERFGLTAQLRRAAISVGANIAEGTKKISKADKLRFLNISQGSLEECRNYIILAKDLLYLDSNTSKDLLNLSDQASWFLNSYIKGISENRAIDDHKA